MQFSPSGCTALCSDFGGLLWDIQCQLREGVRVVGLWQNHLVELFDIIMLQRNISPFESFPLPVHHLFFFKKIN